MDHKLFPGITQMHIIIGERGEKSIEELKKYTILSSFMFPHVIQNLHDVFRFPVEHKRRLYAYFTLDMDA